MLRKRIIFALVSLLAVADSGRSQEHSHPAAQGKLGTVNFATSCNAAAQEQFVRGVALLHSFQFGRATADFNGALSSDSSCGIAYWGIALSNWSNPFAVGAKPITQLQSGLQAAEQGKAIGAKTARERAYVAAVSKLYVDFQGSSQQTRVTAYRDAMAEVAAKYPEDHEAEIFYALALTASEEPTDKTYASRLKAGAILESLFVKEPEHPGLAHYIIHTYDVPPLAGRALVAARRYSQIAPDAPHALHMPSHTFTRVGYWQESIDSNIAASASAKREGQTAEELHAMDYETYAYLQTGQDEAVRRMLESLPEIAVRFNPKVMSSGAAPPAAGYFALAAIPARYALERQDWKTAAQLEVRESPFPFIDAMTHFARGLAAARLGDAKSGREESEALAKIQGQLEKSGEKYWAEQVEIQWWTVLAWTALAEKRTNDALRGMQQAAKQEDGTEKNAISPGPLAPARELLGEMLLEMKQPGAALLEFEATLKHEPKRFRTLYGAAHAAQLAGNTVASRKYFDELLTVSKDADKPGRKELAEAAPVQSLNQ